jgi:N-acyl-D-aspartate/D-glutamate deacylase
MSSTPSLVIRGGTIIDGSGGAPFEADVAVSGGKITAIGRNLSKGTEEIDAKGKIVTPGFVDVHTHYDAQVTWTSSITPSSWNGVTTAVIGNCGVGFAPCRPEQRDMLIDLMEGVEDIPEPVLSAGLPWNWQSFPEYLDALDARQYDLDVVTQVPHAAVRVFVMGQRAADHEPATADDRRRMAEIVADGVKAGALGFSTSRTINHKTKDGRHIPTLKADEAELTEIAMGLSRVGAGWLQVISDFDDVDEEVAMLRRIVEKSGRPMTTSILQRDPKPEEWRRVMRAIADANAQGHRMTGQVSTRPTGVLLGFEISQNPFSGRPSWRQVADLPHEARMARLRDPAFRATLLAEPTDDGSMARRVTRWDRIFEFGAIPNYEPRAEDSVAARAAVEGRDVQEYCYDLLMRNNGRHILYRPLSTFTYGTLDTIHDMMTHAHTLIGLGDGGAHVGTLTDASTITYMLTHWTRDRTRGPKLALTWAIKRLTCDNARAIGLNDRGLLRPGLKADINVIDYDRLQIHAPLVVYDLPAGGKRLMQTTEGYVATVLAGEVVHRDGKATGRTPGRLVRGPRAAPTPFQQAAE